MKSIKTFGEFLNEKSYDIDVNDDNIETITDEDIKSYIEDGYDTLNGIIDQHLQLVGYEPDDMEGWAWSKPNDAKAITRKFKLK